MADYTTEGENQVKRDEKLIEETVHLRKIFPEEIWELVLDNLKDPVDLINAGNASPVFKRMLAPRRVSYLFPAVWDILAVRLHKEEERKNNDPDRVQLIPNPKKEERKWYSDILAARAVCHAWKEAIDEFNFYESLPAKYAEKGGKYALAGTLFDTSWASDSFQAKPLLLAKFLQHFKATHADSNCEASPFLSRRIAISYAERERHPVNTWVTQVLETYGRHVLVCDIIMDFYSVTRDTFGILRQWLSLVPNLISLTILCYGRIEEDTSLDMKVVSRRQRLPKLEKLEHLQFLMCSPPLVRHFQRTYKHVTFFVKELEVFPSFL